MGFLDCPYCGKEATSYLNLGNTFYFIKSIKVCDYCRKPISFNLKSIFLFYFVILPIILLIAMILFVSANYIFENYFSDITNLFLIIISIPLILVWIIFMNILALKMADKIFRIRIFSRSN